MSDTPNILDEFSTEAEWSKEHGVTPRTTARYRRQGLPWTIFAGKIQIHNPGARDWLLKRVRQAPRSR